MSMFSYFARVEGFALKVYATSEEEVISRVMTKHGVVPEEIGRAHV